MIKEKWGQAVFIGDGRVFVCVFTVQSSVKPAYESLQYEETMEDSASDATPRMPHPLASCAVSQTRPVSRQKLVEEDHIDIALINSGD